MIFRLGDLVLRYKRTRDREDHRSSLQEVHLTGDQRRGIRVFVRLSVGYPRGPVRSVGTVVRSSIIIINPPGEGTKKTVVTDL